MNENEKSAALKLWRKRRWVFGVLLLLASLGIYFLGAGLEGRREAENLAYDKSVQEWEKQAEELRAFPEAVKRVDSLVATKKMGQALEELSVLEKYTPASMRPLLNFRRGQIGLVRCEEHLSNFIFFLESKQAEEAREERDAADKECDRAEKLFQEMISSGEKRASDFFAHYGLGNVSVRKAMLAVTIETQRELVAQAITEYQDAMQSLDGRFPDAKIQQYYTHAHINLELLLEQQKKVGRPNSGSGQGQEPLKPKDFDLKLKPAPGAGAGSNSKSQL